MTISCSVNSDNLANLIGAIAIYAFLYSLKNTRKYYILPLLPLLIILGLLTGRTTFFIVPSLVVFSVVYLLKNRKKDNRGNLVIAVVSISLLIIFYILLRYVFVDLGTKVVTNVTVIFGNLNRLFQESSYAQFNKQSIKCFSTASGIIPAGWHFHFLYPSITY